MIGRWSSQHNWTGRIIQWDLEDAERKGKVAEQAELEVARSKAQRQEEVQNSAWGMFKKLSEKASEMLAFPVGRRTVKEEGGKSITIVEPVRWRFSDMAKLVEVADGLGRLATGMEQRRVALTGPDGGPLPSVPAGIAHIHVHTTATETPETKRLRAELPGRYEIVDISRG